MATTSCAGGSGSRPFGWASATVRPATTFSATTPARGLLAEVIRAGQESGDFTPAMDADDVSVLALALIDGAGLPLALGDPRLPDAQARDVVLRCLALLLGRRPDR